jgi:hypothetical protein
MGILFAFGVFLQARFCVSGMVRFAPIVIEDQEFAFDVEHTSERPVLLSVRIGVVHIHHARLESLNALRGDASGTRGANPKTDETSSHG